MRSKQKLLAAAVLLAFVPPSQAQKVQKIGDLDRDRALQMITDIADDVKKHYYDPKLRGFDLTARIREAAVKIPKAGSMDEALATVAWVFDGLDDSHTFFLPPTRTLRVDYGWRMQLIGDRSYIMAVKPKSDAEAKGLKPGDEVVAINGYPPARELFWKMKYLYQILRPEPVLELRVRGLDGKDRTLPVLSKLRERGHHVVDFSQAGGGDLWDIVREMENNLRQLRPTEVERGEELLIVKFPEFILTDSEVNNLVAKARKHKALILDLRGNPGGSVETLERMVGGFFGHDIKIADRLGRQHDMKPLIAKSDSDMFTGKLIVLVDSQSGSAAELFARVAQLQKRGQVLGDRTAGIVMEAKRYNYKVGAGLVVYFGAQITDADLLMADGKSLEHSGVTPDEIVLPLPADLANGRDPALARAAAMLGVQMSPEEAGKLFPFEGPEE